MVYLFLLYSNQNHQSAFIGVSLIILRLVSNSNPLLVVNSPQSMVWGDIFWN